MSDKQREEYIKIYEATDKETADRMVRGGFSSISSSATALAAVMYRLAERFGGKWKV